MPEPLPSREMKDHVLRLVFSILARGGSLRSLVAADAPRLVRALDSVVPTVQTAAEETDALLEAEDGSIWHLEFQFSGGREQVARWVRYHLAVVERYPDRDVHTVILWGMRRRPVRLVAGEVVFGARQVLLGEQEGDQLLEAYSGGHVSPEDAVLLALLPLMRVRRPMPELIAAAVPVLEPLEPALRLDILTAMSALAYFRASRASPVEQARVLEVLREMAITPNLFEDLKDMGRAEGEAKGRRADVLEAFEVRFEAVPEAVRQAVATEKDGTVLSAWLRGIIRAKDQAEAVRLVTGG